MMVIAEPTKRKEVNIHSQKLYCEAISKGMAGASKNETLARPRNTKTNMLRAPQQPDSCAVCQSADFEHSLRRLMMREATPSRAGDDHHIVRPLGTLAGSKRVD